MIVCVCKNISSKKIESLYNSGLSRREIIKITGITRQCGVCNGSFREKIRELDNFNMENNKVDLFWSAV